jgi:hypothetical protein
MHPVRDCACCGEKECAKMLEDELVGEIDLNTKEGRELFDNYNACWK